MKLDKILYTSTHKNICKHIFLSNCPKYFAPFELDEFTEWLDKRDREPYYVYKMNNQVIACSGIYVSHTDKEAGMAWGMVLNELHGTGIGTEMTKLRIKEIQNSHPSYAIRLKTTQHTFKFYEKMGFKVTRIDKDGYEVGMDRYWMTYPNN
jgi:predicted GNAT family N-acyltransferase